MVGRDKPGHDVNVAAVKAPTRLSFSRHEDQTQNSLSAFRENIFAGSSLVKPPMIAA
jgi:hypothetical protein